MNQRIHIYCLRAPIGRMHCSNPDEVFVLKVNGTDIYSRQQDLFLFNHLFDSFIYSYNKITSLVSYYIVIFS